MDIPNMTTPVVPEWLRVSDVYASLVNNNSESEELVELSVLPRCELDCGNALRLYRVMGAWCLSWDRVPKAVFFPLWRELTPKKRRKAIAEYKYYGEELDEGEWEVRMYVRDDVDLFATLTTPRGLEQIVKYGAIQCLRHCYKPRTSILPCLSARYGKLDCLKFLHEHGENLNGCCVVAAANGYLDCLKYAHEHGASWDETCERAACNGNLDCLTYAHGHGASLGKACELAAYYGYLNCLSYAHEHGAPWYNTCEMAASHGHLDCLTYAHNHGAPWGKACEMAALLGRLDCLTYAHKHGAPWGDTCKTAAAYGI